MWGVHDDIRRSFKEIFQLIEKKDVKSLIEKTKKLLNDLKEMINKEEKILSQQPLSL